MHQSAIIPDYISRAELAFHLRVSTRTIKRWADKGKLPPSFCLGSTVLFKRSEVETKLESYRLQSLPNDLHDNILSLKVA